MPAASRGDTTRALRREAGNPDKLASDLPDPILRGIGFDLIGPKLPGS